MVLRVSSSPLLQNNERFSGESIMNTMQVQLHDILVRPEISYIETLKKDIQAKVFLETGIDIASLLYIDSPRYVDKKTVIENCYSYFENVANKLFSKIMTDPQMNLSSVGITHSQTQGEKISVLSPKKTLEYIKFIFSSKNLLEK